MTLSGPDTNVAVPLETRILILPPATTTGGSSAASHYLTSEFTYLSCRYSRKATIASLPPTSASPTSWPFQRKYFQHIYTYSCKLPRSPTSTLPSLSSSNVRPLLPHRSQPQRTHKLYPQDCSRPTTSYTTSQRQFPFNHATPTIHKDFQCSPNSASAARTERYWGWWWRR
jgi:hypothetical protein